MYRHAFLGGEAAPAALGEVGLSELPLIARGKVREIYDLVRDGTGGVGLAAEREAGEELRLAAPEDFADRKKALFERSRSQG